MPPGEEALACSPMPYLVLRGVKQGRQVCVLAPAPLLQVSSELGGSAPSSVLVSPAAGGSPHLWDLSPQMPL